MTAYIIKSGICLILLFGIYWLVLRKEKLLIFNRYYLIISTLFSLTIPFISIPVYPGSEKPANEIVSLISYKSRLNPIQGAGTANREQSLSGFHEAYPLNRQGPVKSGAFNSKEIYLLIYLSGMMLMLVRFCTNILLAKRLFKRSERIDHGWYEIALLDHPVNPNSFLRTIYLNRQDYLENRISSNVLRHELEHVRQSHSYDIIFFEILHIIFWFNPVLFLYKRAVRINHEYLADEAVIKDPSDIETYAGELIKFICSRISVPLTSGFSPSMIRKRLLMLNTYTTESGKNLRMTITLLLSVLLMTILSIKPVYPGNQGSLTGKQIAENDDIVVEEVYFRDPDFKPTKALVVMDGKILDINDTLRVMPQQIKTFDILKDRYAIRKYGRNAKKGVVEISTYKAGKEFLPDSLYFKPIYTINNKVPEGSITMPVSNLYSLSMWTYPVFPKQDLRKRWRTIDIVTRDYYRIRGKVIQDNGEPLQGAVVTATDNPSEAITDKNGRFLLKDVRTDAVAEVSAEGYKPLFFKVRGMVFTADLTITPDSKVEPVPVKVWANNHVKDFSGKWKYRKELTNTPFPVTKYDYDIHQFDSDSVLMNITRAFENSGELEEKTSYVFNTVKTEDPGIFDNSKSTLTCKIGADGNSFSVTFQVKSKLGFFKENKRVENYSLTDDGNQLIITTLYFPDVTSDTGNVILKMVFDRM